MRTAIITTAVVLGLLAGCKMTPDTNPQSGDDRQNSTSPQTKPSSMYQGQPTGGPLSTATGLAMSNALSMTPLFAENRLVSETKTQVITGGLVSGAADTTVQWSVNGVPEGNSTFGFIDVSGLYTAPKVAPENPEVVLTCTSNADPRVSQNIALTIVRLPRIISFTVE